MVGEARSPAAGDLSLDLLVKIMRRLRELRPKLDSYPDTQDFVSLVPSDLDLGEGGSPEMLRNLYVDNHLAFLEECGYVSTVGAVSLDMVRAVKLTAAGRIFVQPELAEFGREPILPGVVDAMERETQVLSYPAEEKAGMIYRLRDALAKQTPDVIAKLIFEWSLWAAKGGKL